MLPLTQPKWQVSSWSPGMSLVVKGLLFSLQGMSVRRGSVLGVGEHCSNVCAVIKAGYLDFVGGWPKWCCGWALVAQIPGYLLERFLRDHPKNKPVPSKVYSVHAWSQKLASILLSSVNCICCLLLLQLCVVMGTHWPFGSEFSLVLRAVQRAWASMQRARGGVRWPCWQGLAGFGKCGRSYFTLPSWLQGLAGVQQGWKGMHAASACCPPLPTFFLVASEHKLQFILVSINELDWKSRVQQSVCLIE